MNLLVCELSQSIGSRRVLLRCLPYFKDRCSELTILSNDAYRLKQDCYELGLDNLNIYSPAEIKSTYKNGVATKISDKIKGYFRTPELQYATYLQEIIDTLVKVKRISAIWYPWIVDHPVPTVNVKSGGMIMDMAWRAYSDGFDNPDEIEKKFIKNTEKLDILFPISKFTESSITEHYPELSAKLVTVPHATDGKKPISTQSKPEKTPSGKFILYPASLTENKNHKLLFSAFSEVIQAGYDATLVLTGGSTTKLLDTGELHGYKHQLRQLYRELPDVVRKRIHIAGHVKDSELSWYYFNCTSVVLPTYYEGFGLPLIEALEHEATIIASNIPPFREQVELYKAADAVTFFDFKDAQQLASLIMQSLQDQTQRSGYDENSWRWKDAADSYLNFLS